MTSGRPGDTESDIPAWVNPPESDAAVEPDADAAPRSEMPSGEVRVGRRRRVIHASTLEALQRAQDEDQFNRRRPPWRGRKALVGLGVGVLTVLLIAVIVLFWINSHLGGQGGAPIQVSLPDQAGHATIADDLGKAHVISDVWLFHRYLDYRGAAPAQGGTYTFHAHEGYRAALRDLSAGPRVVQARLTIPEGYDLKQIAAAVGSHPGLSAQRFLDLANSGAVHSPYQPPGSNNLEGLLFPDTYFISPADSEQTILQRMVDRFAQVGVVVGLDTGFQSNGLSPYETIVLASLVEREAKLDADRGKIAQVILNRLAKGMKLQVDATVEYAEGVHKTHLLDSDLKTQSPYNTYLVAGLPPGPIGGPGKASLLAALQPTHGPWLYYVLIDKSGAHGFATTSAEFERLKEEARAKGLL
ncbi:MAG: endolytic transglycosylase MltG [Acidimicrobiales bacterium]